MTTVSLQERLEEATADLSRCQVSADVAEILRVEGVQGSRGDCEACPVAALLLKRLGPNVTVTVDGSHFTAVGFGLDEAWVRAPEAVAAFIAEFDGKGEYDRYWDEIVYRAGGWDEFAVTSPWP